MEKKVKHICNKCSYMKKEPSLFSEYEVIECSNGLYRTLSIIPSGGGN